MDLTFTDLGHDVGCLHSQIEIIIWILLVKVVVDIRLVRDPPGARSRPQKSGFSAEKQTLLDTIIIFCRKNRLFYIQLLFSAGKTDSFRYNYYFLQEKQTLLYNYYFCRKNRLFYIQLLFSAEKTDSFRYNYYFLQEKQTL